MSGGDVTPTIGAGGSNASEFVSAEMGLDFPRLRY